MRVMDKNPKVRIIIVSACAKEVLRREAMRAGVIDFVAQPFQIEHSHEAINAATSR